MYLAPLNYDRFFNKIFSDNRIARRFLEDFLEVEIEDFQLLKEKHRVTDDASIVEFDFRCKIEGSYIIIDMQQWYKRDVVQRFYLYHALNTGLQLEDLPKKRILKKALEQAKKKITDYRALEPVITLIWMVTDSLSFDNDYVSYAMTPELAVDFIKNERLWHQPEIVALLEERERVLKVLQNDAKDLDFLARNRLIFMFQQNIIKTKAIKKYERWFEFAEKTRNQNNKKEEFKEYEDDDIFVEMMQRLDRTELTNEDLEYIKEEKVSWDEIERLEAGMYEMGVKDGNKKGLKKGIEIGAHQMAVNTAGIMKRAGEEAAKISTYTGLSIEEIEQL